MTNMGSQCLAQGEGSPVVTILCTLCTFGWVSSIFSWACEEGARRGDPTWVLEHMLMLCGLLCVFGADGGKLLCSDEQ